MRFLLQARPQADLVELTEFAAAAAAAGLDGILLRQSSEQPAPLILAAALAGRTRDVLLAVEVGLGDRHPFELAEEAAVVDCASAGRLLLVLHPAPDAEAAFAEALDLVRTALAPRPFRFLGSRWRVPAGLSENTHARDTHVRLTPAPIQVQLPIWGSGTGREAALARGLGYLADPADDPLQLASEFEAAAQRLGAPAIGAPRARREDDADAERLVAHLRDGRSTFGQDWAVIATDAAGAEVIGHRVRPRVQLHHLDPALEQLWEVAER